MRFALFIFIQDASGRITNRIHLSKNLKSSGYIVKAKEVKRIKISKNTYEWKGNLDVELTIDVLGNINNFDTLILMSGDSDFAPLLDAVKIQGKRTLVMSTKGHISKSF